jgi:hypothetical protein
MKRPSGILTVGLAATALAITGLVPACTSEAAFKTIHGELYTKARGG